jgi:hypothetical protein
LSCKAVQNWVEKLSEGRSKVADARPSAEVAETTVERRLCCGSQRTGKVMGQVYQYSWRICRETNIFSRFEYIVFYVSYPFVAYLLTLNHINNIIYLIITLGSTNTSAAFHTGLKQSICVKDEGGGLDELSNRPRRVVIWMFLMIVPFGLSML